MSIRKLENVGIVTKQSLDNEIVLIVEIATEKPIDYNKINVSEDIALLVIFIARTQLHDALTQNKIRL